MNQSPSRAESSAMLANGSKSGDENARLLLIFTLEFKRVDRNEQTRKWGVSKV